MQPHDKAVCILFAELKPPITVLSQNTLQLDPKRNYNMIANLLQLEIDDHLHASHHTVFIDH